MECRVYRVSTWTCVAKFVAKARGIFSPDERIFAMESGPGEITLRRGEDLQEFAKLVGSEENSFHPMCMTSDNRLLFARDSQTQQLHFWNLDLIRQGLSELDLAVQWPDIALLHRRSTHSSPIRVILPAELSRMPTGIPTDPSSYRTER